MRSRRPLRVLPLVALVLAAACAAPRSGPGGPAGDDAAPELRLSRLALGTLVEIVVRDPDAVRGRRAMEAGFAEIERLEGLLSEWRETSEISALNRAAGRGPTPLSADTVDALLAARRVAEDSGGAFDPTVLPLVRAFGFAGGEPRLPGDAEIARLRALVDYRGLVLDAAAGSASLARPGMAVGLGGIGKGFIADRVAARLRAEGVPAAIVKAAGDFACYGGSAHRPWPVSIEDPERPGEAVAEFEVTAGGVSTSAATYRAGEAGGRRVHHLIDPRTGRPAEGARSVTVVAENATLTDGYATAVFVLGRAGPDFVRARPWLRAVVLLDDGTRFVSDGLEVRWTSR